MVYRLHRAHRVYTYLHTYIEYVYIYIYIYVYIYIYIYIFRQDIGYMGCTGYGVVQAV